MFRQMSKQCKQKQKKTVKMKTKQKQKLTKIPKQTSQKALLDQMIETKKQVICVEVVKRVLAVLVEPLHVYESYD